MNKVSYLLLNVFILIGSPSWGQQDSTNLAEDLIDQDLIEDYIIAGGRL